MHKPIIRCAAALMFTAFAAGSSAEVVPIELESVRYQAATLVVAGINGDVSYDQASLEALGAMRMSTITPWRETMTDFDGVLLQDVLAANGLSGAGKIRVTAENGYATEIESETWKNFPILLATRVNGRAHSRRARGPIQFVLPMSASPEVGMDGFLSNWVWMAARIEAVD